MILRDAQAVRSVFPLYYIAICGILVFLILQNIIYPRKSWALYGAIGCLFCAGMVLYAYPVKYIVLGYSCNGVGLIISSVAAILALRGYLHCRQPEIDRATLG